MQLCYALFFKKFKLTYTDIVASNVSGKECKCGPSIEELKRVGDEIIRACSSNAGCLFLINHGVTQDEVS